MHTKIGRDCSICSGGTCAILRCHPCQAAARLRPPPRLAQFPLETCSNPSTKYSYRRQKIMLAFAPGMYYNIFVPFAGVMESVDVVDSKSTAGDSVPVRVRPPAPRRSMLRTAQKTQFRKSWVFFICAPQLLLHPIEARFAGDPHLKPANAGVICVCGFSPFLQSVVSSGIMRWLCGLICTFRIGCSRYR